MVADRQGAGTSLIPNFEPSQKPYKRNAETHAGTYEAQDI
jgi:hypothetical protein